MHTSRAGRRSTIGAVLALAALACAPGQQNASTDSPGPTMSATGSASDNEWRSLFDGKSLAGWRGFKQQSAPTGWTPQNGELVRTGSGGDLMTVEQFGDFELELDWKVESGGNSGVIYRITEEGTRTYESGIEMQVLDDAKHRDGQNALTSAGSLYGLYAPPRGIVKPAGEWNTARILARGNHVEHWLNGTKVVDAELWSPDFRARHEKSKFKEWPAYAKATSGHIALQDHGDTVYYRNIRIRVPQ
jgi:hypothetical protein